MKTKQKEAVFVGYHRVNRTIQNGKYQYAKGDMCIVKEKSFDEQGNIVKELKLVENFQRPFWITKKRYRTYKDKREWAPLDQVDLFRCAHHELSYQVQKALGHYAPDPTVQLRVVNRNPYVYGTDLSPEYIIKEAYTSKYEGFTVGPKEVCVLDIETDVLGPVENKIIVVSLVLNGVGIVYVDKSFISKNSYNYENEFFSILDGDLSDVRGKHGYQVELKIYDDELSILKAVFEQLHEWQPDIVTGWNVLTFDQKVIAERLTALGEDPAMYFSDPRVPDKYKGYYFKEGRKFAISDSGKKTNLRPIARWHEVIAPASFIWVDAMCVYYQLRKVKGMEPSYSLDYILEKNIKRGKYEIEEASKYRRIKKHIFMQKNYPVHYCVYNLFDSIGVDLLDKKTLDLRYTFLDLLGMSSYKDYPSNPTKFTHEFHHFLYRYENHVIGSTSDKMFNEMDEEVPPLSGWIVALPTVHLADNGIRALKSTNEIISKFRNHCGDIDIESSYPWGGIFMNMSRTTTEIEVAKIEGRTVPERYLFGLNLLGGAVNAVSNARIGFKMAEFIETEEMFDASFDKFMSTR